MEIRQLFLILLNTYNFYYDDDKVAVWTNILADVPFTTAQKNLRNYILNPENEYPPHPGALAQTNVERSAGPQILNAVETRIMLDQMDAERQQAPSRVPEHIKERVKLLGLPARSDL